MAQQRKHPSNCEKATRETCECCHCAGTQHSWVDALHMAKSPTSDTLRNFERDADRRWRERCDEYESKRRKPSKATLGHKKAAVDSARANLVRHLRGRAKRDGPRPVSDANRSPQDESRPADTGESTAPQESPESGPRPTPDKTSNTTDPSGDLEFDLAATDRALADHTNEAGQAEALGHLCKQVLEQVEDDVGPLSSGTRKAMAEHFWCELLVQLVVIIEKSNRLLDSVPNKVANEIAKSRRMNGLTKIQRKVVLASARQSWKRISSALGLTMISDAKALLPALRTLGALMCKAPSRHTAVIKHCLDPLKTVLFHETKKRLQRVFSDLVPEITTDLGGTDPLTTLGGQGQDIKYP